MLTSQAPMEMETGNLFPPLKDIKGDDPLVTNREHVIKPLEAMYLIVPSGEVQGVQSGIDRIKVGILRVRELLNSGRLNQVTKEVWAQSFLACGGIALTMWHIYKEIFQKVIDPVFHPTEFADLLLRKSNAYGAGPIKAWGELGVIIRIDSKIERVQTLISHPVSVPRDDESIDDTIKDIVGYCVLGYRLVTTSIL